jgi:Metallo-beta-lactamase superfamily
MAAAGIDPRTIDAVIISHFHPDHISGLRSKAGAAVYSNAEIMAPAKWTFWRDDGEMSKAADVWKPSFMHTRRVFDPIANDVKRFEFGKELVAGITAVDARGHAPGHASFVIASGNARLLYIADATNNPALFARRGGTQAAGGVGLIMNSSRSVVRTPRRLGEFFRFLAGSLADALLKVLRFQSLKADRIAFAVVVVMSHLALLLGLLQFCLRWLRAA